MIYSIRWQGVVGRLLVSVVALGACTSEPSPGSSTTSDTTSGSGDATADTTAVTGASSGATTVVSEESSTTVGSTGPGSTGPGSTGPVSEPEASDCDALRDQASCEALSGTDFECVWFPEAYPVTLDGTSCTIGEPIGWCLAAFTMSDTGCVDDIQWSCMEGEPVPDMFVRETGDDTAVIIQDMALEGIDYGCAQPLMWEACDSEGPAACACGCDPGLPG